MTFAIDTAINKPFQTGSYLIEPFDYFDFKIHSHIANIQEIVRNKRTLNQFFRATAEIVKIISLVALAILSAPITIPLAIIGLTIQRHSLNNKSPIPKRPLVVEELKCDIFNTLAIAHVARKWKRTALSKQKQETDEINKEIIGDSANINSVIAHALENPSLYDYDQIYICRDKELGIPQAIALTKTRTPYEKITYVTTNPVNIRCAVNQNEVTRVQGAATHLIKHLCKKVLKEKSGGLYLEAVESAIPFYKRLGFTSLSTKKFIPDEDDVQPMRLTAYKIRKILCP